MSSRDQERQQHFSDLIAQKKADNEEAVARMVYLLDQDVFSDEIERSLKWEHKRYFLDTIQKLVLDYNRLMDLDSTMGVLNCIERFHAKFTYRNLLGSHYDQIQQVKQEFLHINVQNEKYLKFLLSELLLETVNSVFKHSISTQEYDTTDNSDEVFKEGDSLKCMVFPADERFIDKKIQILNEFLVCMDNDPSSGTPKNQKTYLTENRESVYIIRDVAGDFNGNEFDFFNINFRVKHSGKYCLYYKYKVGSDTLLGLRNRWYIKLK